VEPELDAPTRSLLVDYESLLAASRRITCEFLRIKDADHFAVLDLERSAKTADVETAYAAARTRANADRQLAGLSPEDRKRATEILSAIDDAHRVLIDPKRRELYFRSIASKPQEPARESDPGERDPPQDNPDAGRKTRRQLFTAERAYERGLRLLEEGDVRGAREKFKEAVEAHPSEATYLVAVARALLASDPRDVRDPRGVAFAHIEEALRLDPASIPANLEAARLLIDEDLGAQARPYLDRVLKRAPEHPTALRMLREINK
jgi:tetratricopeptide (TPR) repeat protein